MSHSKLPFLSGKSRTNFFFDSLMYLLKLLSDVDIHVIKSDIISHSHLTSFPQHQMEFQNTFCSSGIVCQNYQSKEFSSFLAGTHKLEKSCTTSENEIFAKKHSRKILSLEKVKLVKNIPHCVIWYVKEQFSKIDQMAIYHVLNETFNMV